MPDILPDTTDMTDREMLIELIATIRALRAALDLLKDSPMLGAFIPGGFKL